MDRAGAGGGCTGAHRESRPRDGRRRALRHAAGEGVRPATHQPHQPHMTRDSHKPAHTHIRTETVLVRRYDVLVRGALNKDIRLLGYVVVLIQKYELWTAGCGHIVITSSQPHDILIPSQGVGTMVHAVVAPGGPDPTDAGAESSASVAGGAPSGKTLGRL